MPYPQRYVSCSQERGWHVRARTTFSGANPRARFIEMLLANSLLTVLVTLTYFVLSALLSPFFSRRDAPWARPQCESTSSSAEISGPSLGGLDSRPTVTPKCFNALEDTGPMEATNVRLRLLRRESARPSSSATANRL